MNIILNFSNQMIPLQYKQAYMRSLGIDNQKENQTVGTKVEEKSIKKDENSRGERLKALKEVLGSKGFLTELFHGMLRD